MGQKRYIPACLTATKKQPGTLPGLLNSDIVCARLSRGLNQLVKRRDDARAGGFAQRHKLDAFALRNGREWPVPLPSHARRVKIMSTEQMRFAKRICKKSKYCSFCIDYCLFRLCGHTPQR